MNCSNIPVELLVATTDQTLYNDNKWSWEGPLYWAVECLDHRQDTVADDIVPNIPIEQYQELENNPTTWDFCKSRYCSEWSDSLLIVFTFKPHSKEAQDYLQFVVDIHNKVTDTPVHPITDNKGDQIFVDIVEVSKMLKLPYVEIWISRSSQGISKKKVILTTGMIDMDTPVQINGNLHWIFITIIIFILVILPIILYFTL